MSLKQMANLLLQSNDKTEDSSYTTIAHDLNSNLDDLVDNYRSHEFNGISSILLTGATGFLGCFLLNELLLTTSMKIVVLVRASSLDEAKNRLHSILLKYGLFSGIIQQIFDNSEQKRVQICLCGNLANENESFSCLDLNNQWNDIDAVLHCAADTNFNMTYENLRQVNVQFTICLLQKCLRHGIPLYYISSLSIFLFAQEDNQLSPPLITELDQPQLSSIVGGYSQSKYVAETLVLRSLQQGLPGAIFRPGRITGSSLSGIGTMEDLFIIMLRGCHQLGAYPQLKFPFDLTPVDKVSKAIVNVITCQQPSRNSAPLIVHLINTQTILFDEQFKLLRRFGCCTTELEGLSYNEWYQRLEQRVSFEQQQQQSDSYNPLLPLLPFLQSSFWQRVEQWPIFAQTNTTDTIIDMCPETLFEVYCRVWKRTRLFD
jgi:thioester reductase-like protein